MEKKGKIILGTVGVLVLLSIIGNINKGDGKSNSSVQTQTSVVTNTTTTQLTTTERVLIEPEEHNNSGYVDYLTLKAKKDSTTASDELIQEAMQWLSNNVDSIFKDNESMENAMYFGELLEYKYKDTGNEYEKLGFQTFKTVKYVYRGAESVEDEVTVNNYNELKNMVNTTLGSNISEAHEESTQPLETQLESDAITESIINIIGNTTTDLSQRKVYIADSGDSKKYHSDHNCSNMDGTIELTIGEAESQGYKACKRCFN